MNFDRSSTVWKKVLVAEGHRIEAEEKAAQLAKINQMLSAVTRQQKVAGSLIKWLSGGEITTGYLDKVIQVINREEHKAPTLLVEYKRGNRKL